MNVKIYYFLRMESRVVLSVALTTMGPVADIAFWLAIAIASPLLSWHLLQGLESQTHVFPATFVVRSHATRSWPRSLKGKSTESFRENVCFPDERTARLGTLLLPSSCLQRWCDIWSCDNHFATVK